MGSTFEGHQVLEEMRKLMPSHSSRFTDLKSSLHVLGKQIENIPMGNHRTKLLNITVQVGKDRSYQNNEIAALCFLILANSNSEKETRSLLADENVQKRLLNCLKSEDDAMPKCEILEATKRIVANDENCDVISKSVMLDWFLDNLQEAGRPEIQKKSHEVIVGMAMANSSKKVLASNQKFQKLFPNHEQSLRNVILVRRFAMNWKNKARRPSTTVATAAVAEEQPKKKQPHVMISYSWKNSDIATLLNEMLRLAGVVTWIDLDNNPNLDMMEEFATAVEESSCLLLLVSSHYKQSVYCKMEARYAVEQNKPIVPVRVDQDYTPNGWIGMLISGIRYHEFYKPEDVTPQTCKPLIQALKMLNSR